MASVVIRDLDQTRVRFEATMLRVGERDAKTAFRRALNHEGRKSYTAVKRALRKQTSIRSATVSKQTRFEGPRGDNLTATIEATGNHLGLVHFKPKQFSYGVRAKVWGESQRFPSAFIVGSLGGNVFKREGEGRLPIKRMFGPSIPREMIKDASIKAFEDKLDDVNKRAMHELTRILAR
ncbi:MAG: hypothetical protein LC676_10765 [Loktanella sp.]|nr:hypothetical protein [Loktanella sp.]